jgi:hypothetical protein
MVRSIKRGSHQLTGPRISISEGQAPISTATPEEISRWAGPTLDRSISGPIG